MRSSHSLKKSIEIGKFIFFRQEGSPKVIAGKVTSETTLDGTVTYTVHEHRQSKEAAVKRRFLPIFVNGKNHKEEAKLKPQPSVHTPLYKQAPAVASALANVRRFFVAMPCSA